MQVKGLFADMNPSISVIIPTHNRPQDIKRALASVFYQTQLPTEVIVVDDGSAPPVTRDVFAYAPAGFVTILLRNESPKGAPHARNMGIKAAKGEWIAFLDDDDEFIPDKIQEVGNAIDKNSQADLFYHPAEINMVAEKIKYVSGTYDVNKKPDQLKQLLIRNVIGGTSMAVVRKIMLDLVGGFNEHLPALQDRELWIKLAKANAKYHYIDKPLTKYIHNTTKDSITKTDGKRQIARGVIEKEYSEEFQILNKQERRQMIKQQLKADVFNALLNKMTFTALNRQLRLFFYTFSITDGLMLVIIPFGMRTLIWLKNSIRL